MVQCSYLTEKTNARIALWIAHPITIKQKPIIVLCFVSQTSRLGAMHKRNVDRGGGGAKLGFSAGAKASAHESYEIRSPIPIANSNNRAYTGAMLTDTIKAALLEELRFANRCCHRAYRRSLQHRKITSSLGQSRSCDLDWGRGGCRHLLAFRPPAPSASHTIGH